MKLFSQPDFSIPNKTSTQNGKHYLNRGVYPATSFKPTFAPGSTNHIFSKSSLKYRYDTLLVENYDTIANKFFNSRQDMFFYDANGRQVEQVSNGWNPISGKWFVTGKSDLLFDVYGNFSHIYIYDYDTIKNTFVNYIKWDITADSSRKVLNDILAFWDSGKNQWVNQDKYDFTYGATGKLLTRIGTIWDQVKSQWVNHDKYDNTYSANGLTSLTIYYNWDTLVNSWVNPSFIEFAYDSAGRDTFETFYTFNSSNQKIISSTRQTKFNSKGRMTLQIGAADTGKYFYDSNGNQISFYHFSYDNNGNISYASSTLYTFDYSISISDVWPVSIGPYSVNMCTGIIDQQWINNRWVPQYRSTPHYTKIYNFGMEEVNNRETITVYPNPATNELTIQTDLTNKLNAQLFDITGKQVTGIVSFINSVKINTEGISQGIYFLKITNADFGLVKMQKVMVVK
ncbi:MAG: T9SS type A sorting domain-containing protein [Bacteroidia bacterium]